MFFSGVIIFNIYNSSNKAYYAKITDSNIQKRIMITRVNNTQMVTTYDKFDAKFRWLSSGSLRKTYNNIENDKIRSDIIASSGKTGF